MSGEKIIAGLKDAIEGQVARVSRINGFPAETVDVKGPFVFVRNVRSDRTLDSANDGRNVLDEVFRPDGMIDISLESVSILVQGTKRFRDERDDLASILRKIVNRSDMRGDSLDADIETARRLLNSIGF